MTPPRPSLVPWLLVACAAILALGGCSASRSTPVRQTFLVQPGPPADAGAAPVPGILLVGGFSVSDAYAGKEMVYRFAEHRYQADFYNEFFVNPREMIGQAALQWLQAARLYETVAPLATARVPGARTLTGFVNEMYADVRDAGHPAAVLAIQFYITSDAPPGNPIRFAQQLRHAAPMTDASAQAYAEGLSRALAAVLLELDKQVRAAKP
jgi:cholesterol transport system auxiliary component